MAVGYMLHHHPVLKRAKNLPDTGAVGRILSVRAEAGFTCHNGTPGRTINFYMSWKTGGGGALLIKP